MVNLGAPNSPVAYYQQVGRAGRGLAPDQRASVVLLPAIEDRDIWAYFASVGFPREEVVRQTLDVLREEGRPLSTAALETRVELNRTRLETLLKVLDVDGAVRRVRGGWEATGRDWDYDEERYRTGRRGARARAAGDARLPRHRCLPDALPARAARRPGRRGLRSLRQLRRPDALHRDLDRRGRGGAGPAGPARGGGGAAEDVAHRPGRSRSGAEGQDLSGAEEGRAIARLTDLGHGNALRDLFREGTPDGPVPVPLARAMVEVLGDWRPDADGIVVVESATRPTLTTDLADGLSRHLQLPVLGRFAIVDPDVPPGKGAINSAHRIQAVSRRFALRADDVAGRRVLLVDDLVVSGWTLTMAATALREAGADAVLPAVLAVTN